ncbi:hypothetical protein L6164_002885 [Bauhinia variegata]|uniref:Uncharacterized protein n=1 Tax=Bauhinia variegata TaxID=167791 RepID=A0ACB9Q1R4_BAUVA|nr:hypothetical protein L6164_002885 [Bauhinia variegata]
MGRELEIVPDFILDKKMEIPQRALQSGDWKSFKRFFQEDKRALLETFDLTGNTAIHIAAIFNKHQLLNEFLEMLKPRDRWHALRRRNFLQSILLHSVNTSVEIAEVVLNWEKELPLPSDDEIEPQEMEEKELPLLESRNLKGETPIYRAAIDGNLKLLKYLTKQVADLEKHFHRNIDKVSILHAAVVAQRFDFLPKFRYKDDEDVVSNNVLIPTGDIEKGENNIKLQISVLSRINSVIWSRLSKEWHGIYCILKVKKKNMLAEQLVDVLARRDNSWQKSFIYKQRTPNISPAILRSKVSTMMKQSQPNREKQYTEQSTHSNSEYTPLLLAAATGILEIVEKLLELYPEVINHVSEDELNILHVAVMYRQRDIY